MASSLTNFLDNLGQGIHKSGCKYGHDNEQCDSKDCDCYLEYTKDSSIEYKCLLCNKNYRKTFDENLKNRFVNTYIF